MTCANSGRRSANVRRTRSGWRTTVRCRATSAMVGLPSAISSETVRLVKVALFRNDGLCRPASTLQLLVGDQGVRDERRLDAVELRSILQGLQR